MLSQLEVADETVGSAAETAERFFLNAAPARPIPAEVVHAAELVVVNRYELDSLPETPRLLALTLGAEGAVLIEDGQEVARAAPPRVKAVDGTAAGDAFTACLVVSLLEERDREEALRRACAAGAIAASRAGAQPSLPTAAEVDAMLARMSAPILLDCDPGHDDAIAILLALGSDELELRGVTTVAGNQTLEKTTANAIRVLELAGRGEIPVAAGAGRPLVREPRVAADVHGETGLDGPDLPPPQAEPSPQHAVDFLAERIEGATLVATGPLTNVALLLARHPEAKPERIVLMGGAIAEGNVTPAAEFNIWADPEAAQRVFASGLDVTMVGLDVTHKALVTAEHAEQLREAGRIGEVVAELLEFYGGFHRAVYGWDGSPIHDAVAVAHVIDPTLLEVERLNVRIDTESELCRGPHGRRPLAAHRPRADRERRRRDRLRPLRQPVTRTARPARLERL